MNYAVCYTDYVASIKKLLQLYVKTEWECYLQPLHVQWRCSALDTKSCCSLRISDAVFRKNYRVTFLYIKIKFVLEQTSEYKSNLSRKHIGSTFSSSTAITSLWWPCWKLGGCLLCERNENYCTLSIVKFYEHQWI